ncbi:acyl-ACP--UDP-N- acetylglucosamine O-acyltransferase [Sulfurimonas sp. HSL-1716]|uniref:acyl-ACP--UDP-N- acetylglucosamine O-acyltransferase n=1 Tax=Hydrocurvibacter sulfurireducens TaxID=3131937 RepID=UPI0031F739D3
MIDKTTIIEDGASIAEDAVIGPFCFIGRDTVIASGVNIASNVIIKGKTTLEENTKIFSFATIGNESSTIRIGKNTHVREFVQIGTQESDNKQSIEISHDNFIMAYVQIMNGVKIANNCVLTNAVRLYENVKCEERVIIGGLSTVEENNRIGTGVMIGGASYVNHDIPPFCLVEGNRSSIKGLNIIGLRRRLENPDDIEEIKAAYKKLLSHGVDKETAKTLEQESQNGYVKLFAGFIKESNL